MTRIQHKRGTATQWTTANPILAAGEKGVEIDTGKFKIGDGTSTWGALPYFLNQAHQDARYALKGSSGGGTFSGNADDLQDGITKVVMLKTEREKLAGVQNSATANSTDTFLRDRANHTGVSPFSSISGLQALSDDTVRKSGSVRQLADISDTLPIDGNALVFNSTPNAYEPQDLSQRFAEKGADGRISEADLPLFYVPTVILAEGASVPPNFPAEGLVLIKGAAAELTPILLDDNVSQGATTNVLTIPQALSVGDYVGLAVVSSNELASAVLGGFTASFNTGAGTTSWSGFNTQTSAYAVVQGLIKITTAVPAGSTLTITARDTSNVAITRPHFIASAFKMPNLATSDVVDQVAIGGGGSSANMGIIGASSDVDTSQASEIAIGIAGYNGGVGTIVHTIEAMDGFTMISDLESDTGSASRSMYVGYKILTSVTKPSFTTQMDASDGSTGSWIANLVTYKGRVS